jgi:hypothetical protein
VLVVVRQEPTVKAFYKGSSSIWASSVQSDRVGLCFRVHSRSVIVGACRLGGSFAVPFQTVQYNKVS